jgi:hypothetical protein
VWREIARFHDHISEYDMTHVIQSQSGWDMAHRYRDTNPLECTPDVSDNHSFQRQATRSGLPRRSVTCSAYHDKSIAHDIAMARRSTCPLHGNMVDYGQHKHGTYGRPATASATSTRAMHFRTWCRCVQLDHAFVDAARHRP